MHIVDQTQHFQGMFQVLYCIFILINKEERSPKQSRSKNVLDFFVDCSIIDAIFVTPTYGTWSFRKVHTYREALQF